VLGGLGFEFQEGQGAFFSFRRPERGGCVSGGKAAAAWSWPLTFSSAEIKN